MTHVDRHSKGFPRNSSAISPTISTVILTGTMVAMIAVAFIFVNVVLWGRVAESDFDSGKQFMQTIGLQIDNVAWTVGSKATVRYSSTYGGVSFLPWALNYTVYVKTQGSGNYQFFYSNRTGVLLFNVDESKFSLGDGYYELIYPAVVKNLTLTGTSAPVARVFGVEKLTPHMSDGSYVRVVVAPSIRSSFANMTTSGSTYYTRLYLPVLSTGPASGSSQSVTLIGNSIATKTTNKVTSIKITVDFPITTASQGFDASFFHFPTLTQIINAPSGYSDSVLELYVGQVNVELGVNT
jgi:hypothetical protein